MSDKLYWRLTANGDATIPKGNGCFHWLRHEYPDYAPIYVVKKEDYQKIQSQLTVYQDELQEVRRERENTVSMCEQLTNELQAEKKRRIEIDNEAFEYAEENQQLKEQLAAKDEELNELHGKYVAARKGWDKSLKKWKADIDRLRLAEKTRDSLTEKCARLEKALHEAMEWNWIDGDVPQWVIDQLEQALKQEGVE